MEDDEKKKSGLMEGVAWSSEKKCLLISLAKDCQILLLYVISANSSVGRASD